MTNTPIQCMSCGAVGSVGRVTANLQCKCGSTDLDLYEGEFPVKTASPHGPGTGWGANQPDHLEGWNEYAGPSVGHNPLTPQQDVNGVNADGSIICPACNGSGRDMRASGGGYDENGCRTCNGTGRYNPRGSKPAQESNDVTTNGPEVGGARWASMQSNIPMTLTMPDGTIIQTTAKVSVGESSLDPKEAKLEKIVATIKSKNAVSDDEARALAQRTLDLYPESIN